MRILAAPDKFKGCLTADQAAGLIATGLRRGNLAVTARRMPLADGGEGTGEALARALGGRRRSALVADPLGRRVRAAWHWFPGKKIALVELAQASGLWRLKTRERDPLRTSTWGTGELIKAVLKARPNALWIAVGGSATVDGGAGLLQALGARMFLKDGSLLERPAGGGDLPSLKRIDLSGLGPLPPVRVLCDVDNPLTGPRGAARAFGPQKGASAAAVRRLEGGLRRWGALLEAASKRKVLGRPRMGAAGGAAAALAAALGARLVSGAQAVLDAAGFDAALKKADWVVTGEGAVDRTSAEGKIVGEVLARARRAGKGVVVLTGRLGPGWRKFLRRGVQVEEIAPGASTGQSIRRAREFLLRAAERAARKL